MGDSSSGGGGGSFVVGLVTGLLAGAAVALALTPQTGEETRDLLRSKAWEAKSKARDLSERASDLYDKGKQVIENARGHIDAAVAEGQEAADTAREHLRTQS
ncbi:MAG TPA: YtxH domain-containing protein [Candidatus Baltobacteraceae bacterium]